MVTKGPAKKLTVYVDETDKFHGKPVYEVLLDIFFKKKIMGASVFRGMAGYGTDGVFHAAKMLRIIISEDDKWEGEPLHEAIIKRLIMTDIAGATVYKAIAGYGPHKRYHKKKTLTVHGELPILITVMDSEKKINKVIPILDELVGEGIVVLSDVNVIKYTHRDATSGLEAAL